MRSGAATPKGLALERFGELVRTRSQGRIDVVVYPNSLLFGDAGEMQALQLGAVDMLAPSLSKFGRSGFPEFELFDLPFPVRDAGPETLLGDTALAVHPDDERYQALVGQNGNPAAGGPVDSHCGRQLCRNGFWHRCG